MKYLSYSYELWFVPYVGWSLKSCMKRFTVVFGVFIYLFFNKCLINADLWLSRFDIFGPTEFLKWHKRRRDYWLLVRRNIADQAFLNTRTNDINNINNIPLKSLFFSPFADWTTAPWPAANECTIMLRYCSFSRTLRVSPAAWVICSFFRF